MSKQLFSDYDQEIFLHILRGAAKYWYVRAMKAEGKNADTEQVRDSVC